MWVEYVPYRYACKFLNDTRLTTCLNIGNSSESFARSQEAKWKVDRKSQFPRDVGMIDYGKSEFHTS